MSMYLSWKKIAHAANSQNRLLVAYGFHSNSFKEYEIHRNFRVRVAKQIVKKFEYNVLNAGSLPTNFGYILIDSFVRASN